MSAPLHAMALDQQLQLAAQGDASAWRALVDAYAPRVFGLLVRQCSDRDLADEITQATFVKVVTRLDSYQEQGKFEPWLFRIAINELRDEVRRRKRQARPMDMTGGSREEDSHAWAAAEATIHQTRDPDEDDPLERVSRAEQVQLLQAAVAKLNPADQEILHLRHTAGLSFPEIAQTLDQPLGTVLARGHRALAKLRNLLKPTP